MKIKTEILCFLVTFFFILNQSCEKSTEPLQNNESLRITTEYFENEVTEEISISDESGDNTVMFLIYAENQSTIDEFKNDYDLKLISDITSYSDDIFKPNELIGEKEKQRSSFNVNESPKIILQLIYSSLEQGKSKLLINLYKKNKKAALYVPGYPIGWTTTNGDFLGTVHRGFGSEYLVQWTYKESWYSSLKYLTIDGVNSWFIYPSSVYYGGVINTYGWYKLNMIIRPDIYQTEVNYLVAFDLDDMYGHNCAVGSYDHFNCYIGTAPTGTNAFFWYYQNIDETWCMYSPVSGNQCPLPGSYFDGANCQYIQIPNDHEKFISGNKWYLRPEIINLK